MGATVGRGSLTTRDSSGLNDVQRVRIGEGEMLGGGVWVVNLLEPPVKVKRAKSKETG